MRGKCRCTMCLREESEGSLFAFDGEMLCHRCLEEETTLCDRCGEPVWRDDAICDRNRTLCRPCFAGQNPRRDCRESLVQQQPDIIHDYPYRPTPVLYGTGDRFLGVELEIDGGGEIPWKALAILRVANRRDRLVYCKHDSSLDNGFELVTHPMTLDFHKNRMPWGDILAKAQALGYVSHHAGPAVFMCMSIGPHLVLPPPNRMAVSQECYTSLRSTGRSFSDSADGHSSSQTVGPPGMDSWNAQKTFCRKPKVGGVTAATPVSTWPIRTPLNFACSGELSSEIR